MTFLLIVLDVDIDDWEGHIGEEVRAFCRCLKMIDGDFVCDLPFPVRSSSHVFKSTYRVSHICIMTNGRPYVEILYKPNLRRRFKTPSPEPDSNALDISENERSTSPRKKQRVESTWNEVSSAYLLSLAF